MLLRDDLFAKDPIAQVALETDGRLTLHLPGDPDDAEACALLLSRGL